MNSRRKTLSNKYDNLKRDIEYELDQFNMKYLDTFKIRHGKLR